MASEEEAKHFLEQQIESRLEAEAKQAAQRMQVTIVPQTVVTHASVPADPRQKMNRSQKD